LERKLRKMKRESDVPLNAKADEQGVEEIASGRA
jgi:hypothetical protein